MALFPGFKRKRVRTSGATINLVTRGDGPPLLLLHGYPATHAMWHKIAPHLARDYTVVCADLRGYGDSSKPKGLPDHSNYSKRAMAKDMVEVMGALGHRSFHLVGHDRGARVAHRLARDHGRAAQREYIRCFRNPRTIHATCEDYRAAASIDLEHDRKDLKKKLRMPVQVLWGKQGVIEKMFKPLRDWREVAVNVRGRALNCGHFLPEEAPQPTLHEIRRFLLQCA